MSSTTPLRISSSPACQVDCRKAEDSRRSLLLLRASTAASTLSLVASTNAVLLMGLPIPLVLVLVLTPVRLVLALPCARADGGVASATVVGIEGTAAFVARCFWPCCCFRLGSLFPSLATSEPRPVPAPAPVAALRVSCEGAEGDGTEVEEERVWRTEVLLHCCTVVACEAEAEAEAVTAGVAAGVTASAASSALRCSKK